MNFLYDFVQGYVDSLCIIPVVTNIFKSHKILSNIINCLIFNGILLLGLYYLNTKIEFLTDDSILRLIILTIYYVVILIPAFLICNVLSTFWIDEIYFETLMLYENTTDIKVEGQGFLIILANQVERLMIIIGFIIQNLLINLLPFGIISKILLFLSLTILHSLYVFEYILLQKYIKDYVSILLFLERKIFYFIGFGINFTLIIFLCNSFITSGAIFLLCFPFYLMLSVDISKKNRFNEFLDAINKENNQSIYVLSFIKLFYYKICLNLLGFVITPKKNSKKKSIYSSELKENK